eukprot:scaffold309_cov235-Pinguiococcus_pyrenoidosus.AAC.15
MQWLLLAIAALTAQAARYQGAALGSLAAFRELVDEGWDPYCAEAALQLHEAHVGSARQTLASFEEQQRQQWVEILAERLVQLGWPRSDACQALQLLSRLDLAAANKVEEESVLEAASVLAELWQTDQVVALLAIVGMEVLARNTEDIAHLWPQFAHVKMANMGDYFHGDNHPGEALVVGAKMAPERPSLQGEVLRTIRDSCAVLDYFFDATQGVTQPAQKGYVMSAWIRALAPLTVEGMPDRVVNEHIVSLCPKLGRRSARDKLLEQSSLAFVLGFAMDQMMHGTFQAVRHDSAEDGPLGTTDSAGELEASDPQLQENAAPEGEMAPDQSSLFGELGWEGYFRLTFVSEKLGWSESELLSGSPSESQRLGFQSVSMDKISAWAEHAKQHRLHFLSGGISFEDCRRLIFRALKLGREIDASFASALSTVLQRLRLPDQFSEMLFAPSSFLDMLFQVGLSDAVENDVALSKLFGGLLQTGEAVSLAKCAANQAQIAHLLSSSDSFVANVEQIGRTCPRSFGSEAVAQRVALARTRLEQMKNKGMLYGSKADATSSNVEAARCVDELFCSASNRRKRREIFLRHVKAQPMNHD